MSIGEQREISEEVFSEMAKIASDCHCFKGRNGEYGKEYGIFLNDHLIMKSTVTKSGERVYYSYLD